MTAEHPTLYCTVILWDLSRSEQTVASLRAYLKDHAVDAYAGIPGLRQKVWVSSDGPEGEQWGAVYLWDSAEAAYGRPPGVSRVVELIGYRPTERRYFGVEAATEGPSTVGSLVAGLGAAYDPESPGPLSRPQEFLPPGADVFIPAGPPPPGAPGIPGAPEGAGPREPDLGRGGAAGGAAGEVRPPG